MPRLSLNLVIMGYSLMVSFVPGDSMITTEQDFPTPPDWHLGLGDTLSMGSAMSCRRLSGVSVSRLLVLRTEFLRD